MEITRAVISEQGAVDLETAEIPDSPGPEEVLVETEASFISAGTELSGYAGLNPGRPEPGPPTYPVYPGYLNAGRILDVGEGVAGFAPGDRVMSWGGHASRHFQTPEGSRLVVHVPDGVGIDEAAASWLAGIAMTGLQAGSTGLNDWVAVFGLGMVGCLAAQLFKLSGARVVGVDPVLARREAAGRVGIEWVVGGDPEAVAARAARNLRRRRPQDNRGRRGTFQRGGAGGGGDSPPRRGHSGGHSASGLPNRSHGRAAKRPLALGNNHRRSSLAYPAQAYSRRTELELRKRSDSHESDRIGTAQADGADIPPAARQPDTRCLRGADERQGELPRRVAEVERPGVSSRKRLRGRSRSNPRLMYEASPACAATDGGVPFVGLRPEDRCARK